jgi:penicillin amidase
MLKLKERNQDRDSFEILQRSVAVENQLGKSVPAWTWNKVHVVEYEHALGKVALLRRIFNVGPVSGSNEVINNQMFDYTNESKRSKGGPSSRRVIDFSDIENSWTILPTGQSGNPFSTHYNDQAEIYNAGFEK